MNISLRISFWSMALHITETNKEYNKKRRVQEQRFFPSFTENPLL
jgi:hypothetical protein